MVINHTWFKDMLNITRLNWYCYFVIIVFFYPGISFWYISNHIYLTFTTYCSVSFHNVLNYIHKWFFYADKYILFNFPMAAGLNTMHTIQWKRLLREDEHFTNLLGTLRAIRLSEMVMTLFRISLYIHDVKLLSADPYMCFLRSPTYLMSFNDVEEQFGQ
jgi:hypothetical protein